MERHRSQIFLFFILIPFLICSAQSPPEMDTVLGPSGRPPAPFKIGVIIDLKSPIGIESSLYMRMAVSDFYAQHPNNARRLELHFRDSGGDPVSALSAAVDLLKVERVHAFIGPQTSKETAILADLGTKIKVPVVSFSATSPSLSPIKTPFFVRAALNDELTANCVADLVAAYGWKKVTLIYEQSEFGTGVAPYIVDSITAVGSRVSHRWILPPSANDDLILRELYKLLTMENRVFIVHLSPSLASRFFAKVNEAGMMNKGFAWIITERLTSLMGSRNPPLLRSDMETVIGMKPYLNDTEKLKKFTTTWLQNFQKENLPSEISDPGHFGLWAYDTVCLLAVAAEFVSKADPGYAFLNTGQHLNDFAAVTPSETGPSLLSAIFGVTLDGLSGKFRLEDGQLRVPALEIVNLLQKSNRTLGFWTPEQGIIKTLNNSIEKRVVPSREDLSPACWPGNTRVIPRGWVDPVVGKTLRVLVPAPTETGFNSLMRVQVNPETNETTVSGYVFDVFEAAIKQLPYAMRIEYTSTKLIRSVTNYDDLVQLLIDQNYDAIVADLTVTFNRSNTVKFTLPYIPTGISMVVPLKDDKSRSAWIFLNPLTPDLWSVIGVFFLLTGATVWILEHQLNSEFRGHKGHQLGTTLYFIFSTLVFSHKEKMQRNLTRFVVIIWLFAVFILQSSYVASLSSMLAVKRLKPAVAELEDLGQDVYVGYLEYSFTKEWLEKKFDSDKLRPYKSIDEYKEALDNGTVSAVIDETPYLRLFLRDHCDNYSMAGRIYRVGGFGFAFPNDSALVSDLSMGILKVTESNKILEIERKWFGDQSSCSNLDNRLNSGNLDLSSFWGLFLITGLASATSLLGSMLYSVYQKLPRKFRNKARDGLSDDGAHGGCSPSSRSFETRTSIDSETYEESSSSQESRRVSMDRIDT